MTQEQGEFFQREQKSATKTTGAKEGALEQTTVDEAVLRCFMKEKRRQNKNRRRLEFKLPEQEELLLWSCFLVGILLCCRRRRKRIFEFSSSSRLKNQ